MTNNAIVVIASLTSLLALIGGVIAGFVLSHRNHDFVGVILWTSVALMLLIMTVIAVVVWPKSVVINSIGYWVVADIIGLALAGHAWVTKIN